MAWTEQLKNGRHRGRYRDVYGKPKSVSGSFPSKRAAVKAAQDEEAKIRAGTWVDPDLGKITFSDYFENQWIPSRINEVNTIRNYWTAYNTELRNVFGDVQVRRISSAIVQNWVADMVARGVSASTVRKRFAVLSVVLAGRRGPRCATT
jgi:hypothetical protein